MPWGLSVDSKINVRIQAPYDTGRRRQRDAHAAAPEERATPAGYTSLPFATTSQR